MKILISICILAAMQCQPNIENLLSRARNEAPHLVRSELLLLVLDMAAAISGLDSELKYSKERVAALNRELYGPSSEKTPNSDQSPSPEEPAQGGFKDKAEDKADEKDPEQEKESGDGAREEMQRLRREADRLSAKIRGESALKNQGKLAREAVQAKLPDGLVCQYCQSKILDEGKYRVAREIDVHPSRFVERTIDLHKGSCQCGRSRISMPPPVRAAEGSVLSPRFVARLILDKFDMSLPVYRQQRMMQYEGLGLCRSTLNRAIARHNQIIEAVVRGIHAGNMNQDYIGVDESPIRYIENGTKRTAWLFCIVSDMAISYKVEFSRNKQTVVDLIGQGPGTLQTDGLNVYDNRDLNKKHAGCLAHMRRYFFQALMAFPNQSILIIKLVGLVYHIEHEAKNSQASISELYEIRQKATKPLMEKIYERAMGFDPPPRSSLGKAVGYMKRHWVKICHFLEDARIRPDNNASERALRLPKLGQKNYLFTQSESGNRALENYYTIIATCRLHGLDPEDYLTDITIRINEGHPMSEIDALLPWNWAAAPPDNLERIRKYVRTDERQPA